MSGLIWIYAVCNDLWFSLQGWKILKCYIYKNALLVPGESKLGSVKP